MLLAKRLHLMGATVRYQYFRNNEAAIEHYGRLLPDDPEKFTALINNQDKHMELVAYIRGEHKQ
ncbi:hypothetical protein TUM4249_10070 [Shewanella sp. KT0246]|nr:hypothetical protein TUM4249_10070 [Shewanella sp. KT0246]